MFETLESRRLLAFVATTLENGSSTQYNAETGVLSVRIDRGNNIVEGTTDANGLAVIKAWERLDYSVADTTSMAVQGTKGEVRLDLTVPADVTWLTVVVNSSANGGSHVSFETAPGRFDNMGITTAYGNDYVIGSENDEWIELGDGNDLASGVGGNDTMNGEAGRDEVNGAKGDDLMLDNYGNSNRSVNQSYEGTGGPTFHYLYGSEGNDVIRAGDFIYSSNAGYPNHDEIISGGDGNDSIYGNGGKDIIYAGPGDDLVNGGSGDDLLYGAGGNDSIYGGPGADSFYGESGRDLLFGNDDYDVDLVFDGGSSGGDQAHIKANEYSLVDIIESAAGSTSHTEYDFIDNVIVRASA